MWTRIAVHQSVILIPIERSFPTPLQVLVALESLAAKSDIQLLPPQAVTPAAAAAAAAAEGEAGAAEAAAAASTCAVGGWDAATWVPANALLQVDGVRVAIKALDVPHFAANAARRLRGGPLSEIRCLEAWGWAVVVVPVPLWGALGERGGQEAQAEWLGRQLRAGGGAGGGGQVPVELPAAAAGGG